MQDDNTIKTNHTPLLIVLLIVLAAVSGAAYFGIRAVKQSQTEQVIPTVTISKPTVSPVPVTAEIGISDTAFVPAEISVKPGTIVTWTNNGKKPHQVVSDPHPAHTLLPELNSDALSAGDTYAFKFEKAGEYTYHDEMNPLKIKGKVIVK